MAKSAKFIYSGPKFGPNLLRTDWELQVLMRTERSFGSGNLTGEKGSEAEAWSRQGSHAK